MKLGDKTTKMPKGKPNLFLGLSGKDITIHKQRKWVEKETEGFEPKYMDLHPYVFAKILLNREEPDPDGKKRFRMEFLETADPFGNVHEQLGAGLAVLKHRLWSKLKLIPQPPWKQKLADHLRDVIQQHFTKSADDLLIQKLIMTISIALNAYPEFRHPVAIHGDATLANLMFRPDRSAVWIDPMDRDYIPWDPHVDLGKIMLSCAGFERVLLGHHGPLDTRNTMQVDLHRLVVPHLELPLARFWLGVHMIRLYPYAPKHLQIELLEALATW